MKIQGVFLVLLGTVLHAVATNRSSWLSPDKHFLVTCVAGNNDGTGSRLMLSTAAKPDAGVVLRENDRWIEANWSQDSKFLEVTDGSDGHVTDVFIYRVTLSDVSDTKVELITFPSFGVIANSANAPGTRAELWYHTPDVWTYDTRWKFLGWVADKVSIRLLKHTRGEKDKTFTVTLKSPIKTRTMNAEQESTQNHR